MQRERAFNLCLILGDQLITARLLVLYSVSRKLIEQRILLPR